MYSLQIAVSNILLRIRRIVEGAQEEYDIMVAEDKVRGIPLDICAFDVTKLKFFFKTWHHYLSKILILFIIKLLLALV